MKFLFDLFPVILFFAAFKMADIYVATGIAIAATFAQVGWLKLRRKRVEPMLWASLAIIVVFGGATWKGADFLCPSLKPYCKSVFSVALKRLIGLYFNPNPAGVSEFQRASYAFFR